MLQEEAQPLWATTLEEAWLYHPPTPVRGVQITIVGCGGTGSHVAEALVATLYHLAAQIRAGRVLPGSALFAAPVSLQFVDPDVVEPHNVGRQLFTPADVGRNKAEVLATRYSRLYALPLRFHPVAYHVADHDIHPEPEESGARHHGADLRVLVGCVDNTAARREMHRLLGWREETRGVQNAWSTSPAVRRDVLLVDCGNERHRGQVLVGSAVRPDQMHAACPLPGICTLLPAPGLVQPELLALADEADRGPQGDDCAARVLREEQSLHVNRMVAAVAASLLHDLLTGSLRRFGAYCDVAESSATPLLLCPADLARMVGVPVDRVVASPKA